MGIRCFIAVPLDPAMKEEIVASVADLRQVNADVKWVQADNLHLTLRFLGDTDEGFIPSLTETLSLVSPIHGPFAVDLQGVGLFPEKGKPRVVWIDIRNYQELARLHKDVEEALFSIGIQKEDRPFSPHLTIGRVRSPKNVNVLLKRLQALREKDFGALHIRSFSLMKSELRPSGPEYTELKEFDLKRRSDDQ